MSQNGHVVPSLEPTEPPKPFKKEGLGYVFEPVDEQGHGRGVRLRADYLKRRGEEVSVELTVESTLPGVASLLHQAKFNLSSMTSARELAKHLAEIAGVVPWRPVLLEFSASILAAERRGQPFLKVGRLSGKAKQTYLIEPLLVERKFNVLYGPGGVGKGNVAVWTAVVVQAGLGEVCGMRVQPANVLYLDWEDDELTLNGRVQAIAAGLGIEPPEIHYRACRGDLRGQVEQIARYVVAQEIGYVIVDSVEMACGAGDGETYQNRALALFEALRSCGDFTTLLIDHVSEEGRQNDKPGIVKPYGSIFKVNEVRWGWEMRKDQPSGSYQLHAGLYHAKANNGPPMPPVGLLIDFTDDECVSVSREDVRDNESLSQRVGIQDRMARVLERENRALSISELVGLLGEGAKEDSVRKAANRYRAKLFAALPDGRWGLVGKPTGRGVEPVPGQLPRNVELQQLMRIDADGREVADAVPF